MWSGPAAPVSGGVCGVVTCGLPAARPGCEPEDVSCSDGACVPAAARCDGVRDCVDGVDELDCGTNPAWLYYTERPRLSSQAGMAESACACMMQPLILQLTW